MARTHRFPSALGATAALVASLVLGLASGAHAQAPQQPLQPQPGAINPASAQPLPPTEAPINTQTPRPNAPGQAVKLELPATFAGVLPCADCAGVAHTLTLQSDGSYRLRRTYLGKAEAPVARSGRWTADRDGQRLALRRDDESTRAYFSVQPDGSLHALDTKGSSA